MRLTAPIGPCLTLAALAAIWMLVPWPQVSHWAAVQQREFQNAMARALRAIQAGEPAAVWSLCLATAAYGFVHALGPGHGKVLLGGAALASGATLRRMAVLTVTASLAQSLTAVALIAILVRAMSLGSADAVALTETWLAPISYAAVGAIGAVLLARGVRGTRDGPDAPQGPAGCGHHHGPDPAVVRSLSSLGEAAALVASIAIRPCTGALFLLVIAARFDVFGTGILAVLAMGAGTSCFNLIVAGSGVAARSLGAIGQTAAGAGPRRVSAALHLIGGGILLTVSLILLRPYLG